MPTSPAPDRQGGAGAAHTGGMFLFFSNRLGCLGSILVSLLLTGLLLIIFL